MADLKSGNSVKIKAAEPKCELFVVQTIFVWRGGLDLNGSRWTWTLSARVKPGSLHKRTHCPPATFAQHNSWTFCHIHQCFSKSIIFSEKKQNTLKVIIVNYIIFLKEKKSYSIALKKTKIVLNGLILSEI